MIWGYPHIRKHPELIINIILVYVKYNCFILGGTPKCIHWLYTNIIYHPYVYNIIDYKTMSTGSLDFQKLKVIKGDQWWSAKECQWFLRIWRVVDFTHVRFHPVTLWAAPFEFTVVLRITVWVYESSISHWVTWYFGANADLARNYMTRPKSTHTSENGVFHHV